MTGQPRFVWVILAQGVAQDPACWDGDFTETVCCDRKYGPRGAEECWDPIHTYERCCGVQEDCWDDEDYDHETCCDLVKGDQGDQACWSGAQTFEYCCSGDRAPVITGDQPLEELPSFGKGCWDADNLVTFARCCSSGLGSMKDYCWSGGYTYGRCCTGLVPIRRYFMDLPREHELVRCLRESLEGPVKANANISIEECDGRYIYISAVSYRFADVDVMHDFWWQRPQDDTSMKLYEVNAARGRNVVAPEWLAPTGAVCVPKVCSDAAVAGWFASMVDVGQFAIPPSYRELNGSHVRVSPLAARLRPYPSFNGSWLLYRPQADAVLRKQQKLQDYFEFVLSEHINWKQLRLSANTQGVLLALALPVVFASLLQALGVEAAKPLSLQSSLKALGSPRQRYFDLCRIVTSIFIVATHVKDHYLFPSYKHHRHSMFGYVVSTVEAIPVNPLVVLLMIFMVLRRLDKHPPALRGPFSWFLHVISYAFRRWVLIMSIVGIWLYFYVAVIIEEVPLPNIGKSRFLYVWFWRNRVSCMRGKHLIPTIFLVHEAAHAYPSTCHNISIFEMCYQVDVVLMAALLLLPRRLSALLSALAYIPVARRGTVDAPHPSARCIDYLPVGLLTIAVANGLPKASTLAQRHWPVRLILWSFTLACYGIFGFMTFIEKQQTELQVGQLADQLGVSPWVLTTLPVLLGTVVLLRLLDAQASSPGPGWSPCSALGRLCGQINISHLFVLQIHRGFTTGMNGISSDDVYLPPSSSLFLRLTAALFVCSAAIATILFVFIEAPVQALLSRSDHTGRRRGDHSNGTTNGHVVNGHRR